MSEEDAEEAVIRPMRAMFPAPRHLRADEDALDATLTAYRRSLARFDRPVLETAWQKVVEQQEVWCWPKLGCIVRDCEAMQPRRAVQQDDWVERANDAAWRYAQRFVKTTAAGMRAREGGYEQPLKQYVQEAAWVQAQMIEGRQGVGYNSTVLFRHHGQERDKEAEAEFFRKCKAQAETGSIRVTVPPAVVKDLKERCQGQARVR